MPVSGRILAQRAVKAYIEKAKDPIGAINDIREYIHTLSPTNQGPVDFVRWVPLDMVQPNDYNPNSVARIEMGLLLHSINEDGYTQPTVTIWDEEIGKYVIVDGFHRYFVMKSNKEVFNRYLGHLPITVIEKDINQRMASTVRHNRARGKHSVQGMANMVFNMLDNGMSDAAICNELGMEPEELLRLKHITGFSKLFEDQKYRRAWMSKNQIDIRKAHKDKTV
jgi:ParB-like chromosome segregation protein Spo0J